MADEKKRRRHRRGRRKRKQKGGKRILTTIILIISIAVFCVAAFQLYKIVKGYLDGRGEYDNLKDLAVAAEGNDEKFRVDFDALLEVNPDTVGWLRFYPQPEIISYPVVQGEDNEEYLTKTFSSNENTLGAIFVDAGNKSDFLDKNTLIYGHRMKDGSMFRHLWDYDDEEFYKENQYFYIYTPDGKEITYHIYAVSRVEDTSDIYTIAFESQDQFQNVISQIKSASYYDTGVEVGPEDTVVTLSTCTAASDEHRLVVCGVKEKEVKLED